MSLTTKWIMNQILFQSNSALGSQTKNKKMVEIVHWYQKFQHPVMAYTVTTLSFATSFSRTGNQTFTSAQNVNIAAARYRTTHTVVPGATEGDGGEVGSVWVGSSRWLCIVNEKLFTNWILFHRRPAGRASPMGRGDGCDGSKAVNLTPEVGGLGVMREPECRGGGSEGEPPCRNTVRTLCQGNFFLFSL